MARAVGRYRHVLDERLASLPDWADGLEKISTTYEVFFVSASVPESVPVLPVPGANVKVGGRISPFAPSPAKMPPFALPKIEFRVNWICWPAGR